MDVLKELNKANPERCQAFGHGDVYSWSPTDWACAIAGETGELCNLVKKLHRGDKVDVADIGKEAADIVIYLDLFCTRMGIDLQQAIVEKFNEVSDRVNSEIKLVE